MGVKDFAAAITPGSKPSAYAGCSNYKILANGCVRSSAMYDAQKLELSPNGGVLNHVCLF